MNKKITKMIAIAMLAAIVGVTAIGCGSNEDATSTVSSAVESSVISETSQSLGIYVQDTDNDGIPDLVVDRYGNDLSELYTLREDGIYEDETLVLPIENTENYVAVTEIAFTIESKTVHPENEFALDVVFLPENATCMEYDLTVDNEDVLKIESGIITALTNGEATVTATAKAGGATATCLIIVNAEVEETEAQNEQAIASGGTVNNSNANNNSGSTVVTSGNRNTNTGSNNNITVNTPANNTTNNTGNSNNTQKPTTSTTPATPQPQVHAPISEKRWVVDQAAWSEERPVYDTRSVIVCSVCGSDVPGTSYHEHGTEHALKGEGYGYHVDYRQVQVGTQTIYHDEVGHWEDVLICGGCTGAH